MTKSVGVHEAKTHLSELLVRVGRGEEVVITNRGVEVARLVPPAAPTRRVFGIDDGRLGIPEDFDAPLDADLLEQFSR